MALLYGSLNAGYGQLPIQRPDAGKGVNANVRVFREIITLASQPTTDTLFLARVPAGYVFLYGLLCSTVSLGTSTLAIGITGTTGKYRAAATFTAVDTPTIYGPTSALDNDVLASDEVIFGTIAVASLPASGTLVSQLFFSKA